MNKRTQQMTLSAMFMAFGVLFPMLFHGLGLGSIFLPMFWPVAAAAFFLDAPLAIAVALLAPVLSSMITGMPPVSPPILQVMMAELFFLAAATSLFYTRTRWGIFWPLLIGLLLSRIVLFLTVIALAPLLGLPPTMFSVTMVVQGMPGVVAILILLPIVMNRIKHEPVFSLRK